MREASAARFYELMVITAPDGTPEELLATVDQIIGYITTAGGSILRSNSDSPWGRRRLAYPIRYQSQDVRDGFYTLIHLEMAPDKVIEVERDLKLNDRLMRYMVIQLAGEPVFPEPEEEEPAATEASDTEATQTGGSSAPDGEGSAPAGEVTAPEVFDGSSETTATAAPAETSEESLPEAPAETSEATAEDRRSLTAADEPVEVAEAVASDEISVPDTESAESKE